LANKDYLLNVKKDALNKVLLHGSFNKTISDIKKFNIKLPKIPKSHAVEFHGYTFPPDGQLVNNVDEINEHKLDEKNGEKIAFSDIPIAAYDESINKYSTLEGDAYLTSHSMVIHSESDYIPMNLLTLYFYTRAKNIADDSTNLRYSDFPEVESKKDYFTDKVNFIEEYAPENLIDGPLIGGDYYVLMIQAIKRFLKKNIIPVFFVKNSTSNLVTDNIKEFRNRYNSDLHWAFRFLKPGYRTSFFKYIDQRNVENAKFFCYIKPFDISPQRVEFHVDTYTSYKDFIPSILDLIYYLLILQGDKKNSQVRSIAVAEKFARETIHMIDIESIMKFSSSAAHVTGKSLVSSETFSWLREHFMVSLSHCKPDIDKLFIAGINHIFYQGIVDILRPGVFPVQINPLHHDKCGTHKREIHCNPEVCHIEAVNILQPGNRTAGLFCEGILHPALFLNCSQKYPQSLNKYQGTCPGYQAYFQDMLYPDHFQVSVCLLHKTRAEELASGYIFYQYF